MRGAFPSYARRSAARVSRLMAQAALCVLLTGCITGYEKPEFTLEVPDNYRYAPRRPDAALPALDWWRGFRSRELISLIEAAQTENLDIAAAVARVVQADGQVRVSGSPLLPAVDADASVTRSRSAQRTTTSSGLSSGSGSGQVTIYN